MAKKKSEPVNRDKLVQTRVTEEVFEVLKAEAANDCCSLAGLVCRVLTDLATQRLKHPKSQNPFRLGRDS